MDFTSFREKLITFFTPEQIGHLDAVALWDAVDTHGKPHDLDTLRTLHYMGRDFICILIADDIFYPGAIERMTGSPMTPERREALIKQIDIEW